MVLCLLQLALSAGEHWSVEVAAELYSEVQRTFWGLTLVLAEYGYFGLQARLKRQAILETFLWFSFQDFALNLRTLIEGQRACSGERQVVEVEGLLGWQVESHCHGVILMNFSYAKTSHRRTRSLHLATWADSEVVVG